MSHAVPLPLDQLTYGPGPNPFWPNAAKDLSPHTAHVRVVSLTEPKDRVELVIAYGELMNIVSGIANVAKAIGVLWCPADNLLPAQTFISMRDFVLQTNLEPAEIYARLVFVRRDDKISVATHGLRPLIGREIEFTPIRPQDLDPEAMYDRVFQIAKYLIAGATNDPPRFKHGDRVGPEKFRVDLADTGAIAKEPVYLIVASDSAVEV
jgi:hypothetical protein